MHAGCLQAGALLPGGCAPVFLLVRFPEDAQPELYPFHLLTGRRRTAGHGLAADVLGPVSRNGPSCRCNRGNWTREANYFGPIIALTANAMAEDEVKCRQADCDDYATKPIDRVKLFGIIAQYLGTNDSASKALERTSLWPY